jgi:hypothetical protein
MQTLFENEVQNGAMLFNELVGVLPILAQIRWNAMKQIYPVES